MLGLQFVAACISSEYGLCWSFFCSVPDLYAGYIDLSKRRVAPEDMAKCEERYNKAKAVHSIMRHVAYLTKYDVEHLYEKIAWPLAKKYGEAYEALKLSILYVSAVFFSPFRVCCNCCFGCPAINKMSIFLNYFLSWEARDLRHTPLSIAYPPDPLSGNPTRCSVRSSFPTIM